MSLPESIEIECPACALVQEATIWRSINVTLDAELREQLLDGSLSLFECKKCGAAGPMNHALLYHDMEARFMIYQLDEQGRKLMLEQGNSLTGAADIPGLGEMLAHSMSGYRMRVVGDRNELIEKVRMFSDGLDDRLVEGMKAFVWSRIQEQQQLDEGAVLYYASPEAGMISDDAMTFTLVLPDDRAADVPMEGIGNLLGSFSNYLAGQPPLEGWSLVDMRAGQQLMLSWWATQEG